MAVVLLVGAVVAMHRRGRRQPAVPGRRRPGGPRQHGGQGDALRRRRRRPVHGRARPAPAPAPINSWHDSAQPIAGLVPLFNMELGEVTPGGIGAGLYGMLVIGAILAVFIAGLMVGRTPGVPRQEGRGLRDQDGDARRPRAGRQHPGLHGPRERPAGGHGRAAEPRPARLQRDPLRLLEPDRQQRLGLRRPDRQHALLQHHRRPRDARSAATG